MTINFKVTGKERKALVQALSEIAFSEAIYAGAPSFAYQVGDYIIDKDGVLTCPSALAQEAVALVVEKLRERGFTPADEVEADLLETDTSTETPAETPDVAEETEGASANSSEDTEGFAVSGADNNFAVSIPRSTLADDALERLKLIIANKEVLFKRAVVAETLPVEVTEEEITFPWFTLTNVDGEAAAYTQFVKALCQMASEQTRVLDKPYDGDNDRFAMRIFMVRLGMKGAQYALARKLMMNHLAGNSGWRYGAPPKKKAAPTAPEPNPASLPREQDDSADAQDAAAELPDMDGANVRD